MIIASSLAFDEARGSCVVEGTGCVRVCWWGVGSGERGEGGGLLLSFWLSVQLFFDVNQNVGCIYPKSV